MSKHNYNLRSSHTFFNRQSASPLHHISQKHLRLILSKQRSTFQQTKDNSCLKKSVKGKKHKEKEKNVFNGQNKFSGAGCSKRYLTQKQQITTKCQKKSQTNDKFTSPQRTTIKKQNQTNGKSRLSLNSTKKCKNINAQNEIIAQEYGSQKKFNIQKLIRQRSMIQKAVKKSFQKNKLYKKDILKISNRYENLLNRIVFSQLAPNLSTDDLNRYTNSLSLTNHIARDGLNDTIAQIQREDYEPRHTNEALRHSDLIRQSKIHLKEDDTRPKVAVDPNITLGCAKKNMMNLHLGNIRKLGIVDYNDEFMSHYQQLSQSWKRDIVDQKRF